MKTRYQDHMRCGLSNTCRWSRVSLVELTAREWRVIEIDIYRLWKTSLFALLSDPCAFSSSVHIYSMCSSYLVIWSCYCKVIFLIHDHTCFLCNFYDQTACLWFCMWPGWGSCGSCRSINRLLLQKRLGVSDCPGVEHNFIMDFASWPRCFMCCRRAVVYWYRRQSRCGDSSIKKEK